MTARTIVIVDINQFFGGGQVYGLQLAEMLSQDFDVTIICVQKRFADELRKLSVRVIDYSGILRLGRITHQGLITALCVWLRLRGKADLVWINGIPEIVVAPFARALGSKVLITRHLTLEIESQGRLKYMARVLAEFGFRLGAPLAHKVICVSHAVSDAMLAILPPTKLEVIHNWVQQLPQTTVLRDGRLTPCRFLFAGRLEHHKGPFTMIEAMHLLANDPEAGPLSLTVIGQGRARADLEKAAEGLDVHFMGFQPDPASFYLAVDAFVNPSLGPEGLPLVTLDAMSHGLPCILSDLPVHVEVSNGGQAALIFRAGDPVSLANQIKTLLNSDRLREKYGRLARQVIEADYVLPVARAKYLRSIGSLDA